MAARAGKDLISCICSGLLTIGPRFGGAIDDAARFFFDALKDEMFVIFNNICIFISVFLFLVYAHQW